MFHVFKNILWFLGHFFSLKSLTLTLFAPFKRITEEKGRSWNFEDFFGRILINLISRIIGALIRGILLLVGISSVFLSTIFGLVVYALWFLAPILVIASLATGVTYLFL